MKNKFFTIRVDIHKRRERKEPRVCSEMWKKRINKKGGNNDRR